MFWYWVCVASIGNFIDYAPTRTFTDGADLYQNMFAVERGLHWSPWTLLVVFGIPAAFALAHFFLRIEPSTMRWLFPVPPPGGPRWQSSPRSSSSTLMAPRGGLTQAQSPTRCLSCRFVS